MKFSSFIRDRVDDLVAEWEAFARALPEGSDMTALALRDHCREILLAAADDMDTIESTAREARRSRGQAAARAPQPAPRTAAALHGALREVSGFQLPQMVAEFRALRASALALWREAGVEKPAAEAVEEVSRFNEAIDQALSESVQSYSASIDQSRDMFLATLGHDLRGPLAVIEASRALLERPDFAQEKRLASTKRIRRAASSMAGLISDLMGYTRSRLGGGIPIALGRCDLGRLCEEAIDGARASHPGREFVARLDGDLIIEADPARIEQVLSNLLLNAAQHGRVGSPIVLEARRGAGEVSLSVANQSEPISEDALRTIFEPFVRGTDSDQDGERSKTSLGLGLFIVREIVRGHGGQIDVESSAEGGTVFVARLPVSRAE